MWGRAALTTSPSVRSSTRSTPWVAGCWGPIWMTISSVSRSSGFQLSGLPGMVWVALIVT